MFPAGGERGRAGAGGRAGGAARPGRRRPGRRPGRRGPPAGRGHRRAGLRRHGPARGFCRTRGDSRGGPAQRDGTVPPAWPGDGARVGVRGRGHHGVGRVLGTVLQSAWLPGLWVVFRVRGVSAGRAWAAVLAAAATGVMCLNTLYVWPKMLAGALALCVLAILLSRDPGDRWRGAGVLAAALAALSMLSHGGTAFGLLALV